MWSCCFSQSRSSRGNYQPYCGDDRCADNTNLLHVTFFVCFWICKITKWNFVKSCSHLFEAQCPTFFGLLPFFSPKILVTFAKCQVLSDFKHCILFLALLVEETLIRWLFHVVHPLWLSMPSNVQTVCSWLMTQIFLSKFVRAETVYERSARIYLINLNVLIPLYMLVWSSSYSCDLHLNKKNNLKVLKCVLTKCTYIILVAKVTEIATRKSLF